MIEDPFPEDGPEHDKDLCEALGIDRNDPGMKLVGAQGRLNSDYLRELKEIRISKGLTPENIMAELQWDEEKWESVTVFGNGSLYDMRLYLMVLDVAVEYVITANPFR